MAAEKQWRRNQNSEGIKLISSESSRRLKQ